MAGQKVESVIKRYTERRKEEVNKKYTEGRREEVNKSIQREGRKGTEGRGEGNFFLCS
jgi:hypothetical protein